MRGRPRARIKRLRAGSRSPRRDRDDVARLASSTCAGSLGFAEKGRRGDTETDSNPIKSINREIALTPLNERDVRAVHPSSVGKFFLRNSSVSPPPPNHGSKHRG